MRSFAKKSRNQRDESRNLPGWSWKIGNVSEHNDLETEQIMFLKQRHSSYEMDPTKTPVDRRKWDAPWWKVKTLRNISSASRNVTVIYRLIPR